MFEETRNANTAERTCRIDAIAALRYNNVDVDYSIAAAAFGLTTAADRSSVTDRVGAVGGVRIGCVPAPNWLVTPWGDNGGFGVGSEQAWHVMRTLGYRFETGIAPVGWCRVFVVDYEQGRGAGYLSCDLLITGPVVGANYKF